MTNRHCPLAHKSTGSALPLASTGSASGRPKLIVTLPIYYLVTYAPVATETKVGSVTMMHLSVVLALFTGLKLAASALPPWPATYVLNASTIIMPCSFTNKTDPSSVANWGITDFDWSNDLDEWSAAVPMDTDERLLAQVKLSKAANPTQRVWIYRNSVYGYPCVMFSVLLGCEVHSTTLTRFPPLPPLLHSTLTGGTHLSARSLMILSTHHGL